MTIPYGQLMGVVARLNEANRNDQLWIAIDSKVEQVSGNDLHFFDTELTAHDFRHYHSQQNRDITLLPLEATRYYVNEQNKQWIKEEVPSTGIFLDKKVIGEIQEEFRFNAATAMLTAYMDSFDWSKVFYDPLEANTQAESVLDKIDYNRLEHMVELLTGFAKRDERSNEFVSRLVTRHWKDQPMESQIDDVIGSTFQLKSTDKIYVMNTNNLDYVLKNVKYTGFGEKLFPEITKAISDGDAESHPQFKAQVDGRPFEATLNIRRSNTSDMYFFNGYTATAQLENGEKRTQSITIVKGKGYTGKEAHNLLQGRPVRREFTNAKGEAYKRWRDLDFNNKDERGNYKYNSYKDSQFDLDKVLGKYAIIDLDGGEKEKDLKKSLEHGNRQVTTFDYNGDERKLFIEVNIKENDLNFYDEGMLLMNRQEIPLRAVESQKLEAKQDLIKQPVQEQTAVAKQGNAQKQDNGVIKKKRERKQNKQKIG